MFCTCFFSCRGQPAVPVITLQWAQDYECCVGTSGRFCHCWPWKWRDQPVQCQGWKKWKCCLLVVHSADLVWLHCHVSSLRTVWRCSEEGEGAQQANQRHPNISGSHHVHHCLQGQHCQGSTRGSVFTCVWLDSNVLFTEHLIFLAVWFQFSGPHQVL